MRNIKKYKLNSDYTSNKDNLEYPTVSYVEENTKVFYKEKPAPPIVTYTTTGASQQVKLVHQKQYLDYAKILDNGEELTVTGTDALNYTFENPGEHQVELKFKDDATTLASGFSGCSQLTSIPDNLFNNNTAVSNFSYTFYNCSGLTSIPENLFKYNTAVTSFSNTFQNCSGLTSIPANLFSNNTKVTYFSYTFSNCSQLTGSIPENLFSNNTAVTNFTNTFYNCKRLTNIPEKLFSNNTKVTSFFGTFKSCSGLTGNTPVDSDGTPIYNRSGEGKDGYAVVTNYVNCFGNCTGLTDYSSIPSGWKELY